MTDTGQTMERIWSEFLRRLHSLRERYRIWTGEGVSEARGVLLLREWLSSEQRAQFDTKGCFDVIGCQSGKRFRIHRGTATNVYEIDDEGRATVGWCFVPSGQLVAGDVMLAQKIALETNELVALAVANRFPVQIPDRRRVSVVPP
ncbi:hypothetical protein [Bradyrhizobium genosp. P]|uniref:hypothetical protein n=1 Tax=Bradyrhizobium genosp. P TaxID=83641 RepID=UPI003CEA8F1F